MDKNKKQARYQRIYKQLKELLPKTSDSFARMSSIIAVLHHKMEYFFWTGFYFLKDNKLVVGQYQGPVACQELKKDTGICWAVINQQKTIIVPDVEKFPGHIACDARSKSEVVIPVRNQEGTVVAVLDADSDKLDTYDDIDEVNLQALADMIYS